MFLAGLLLFCTFGLLGDEDRHDNGDGSLQEHDGPEGASEGDFELLTFAGAGQALATLDERERRVGDTDLFGHCPHRPAGLAGAAQGLYGTLRCEPELEGRVGVFRLRGLLFLDSLLELEVGDVLAETVVERRQLIAVLLETPNQLSRSSNSAGLEVLGCGVSRHCLWSPSSR